MYNLLQDLGRHFIYAFDASDCYGRAWLDLVGKTEMCETLTSAEARH